MKNSFITLSTVAIITSTCVPAFASLPGYNSSYWYKTRTMHIKKAVTAYQINPNSWSTHSKKHLKKGTKVRVTNTANLSWTLKSSKLKNSHGYVWVVKGHYNTSWLKR